MLNAQVLSVEGSKILNSNLVEANLVHREYKDSQEYGDIVTVNRPQDELPVPVTMNQHLYCSFCIKDSDRLTSAEIETIYVRPAVQTIARGLNRITSGQAHAFLNNCVGRLSTSKPIDLGQTIEEASDRLDISNVPVSDRSLIVTSKCEKALLSHKAFKLPPISKQQHEDLLGNLHDFDVYMNEAGLYCTLSDCRTHIGGFVRDYEAGYAEAITTYNLLPIHVGEFVVVGGVDQPTYATEITVTGDFTRSIKLNAPLKYPVVGSKYVTVYTATPVRGNYSVGWSKEIILDNRTTAPGVGRLVAFGNGSRRRTYTIIEAYRKTRHGDQLVYLDRPLEFPVTNNELCYPGPAGSFNLAFHKNALVLVTCPLTTKLEYDMPNEQTIVTFSMLAGLAVLDLSYGVVVLG